MAPAARQVRKKKWDTHEKVSMAMTYRCPVEATLDVIGGKWKALILWWLRDGVLRFGELRRKIPDVSERMLTQQLRELERHGVVRREVYPQVPPKVEYGLTAYGRTLRPITDLMCTWGKRHMRRPGGLSKPEA
jgi:DNA-binding HxlR family transcriptional regulator